MDDRSIVAAGLTRRFGQQTAVDAVDLEVPSGQIFAFLGPNGAGKSTVVRMLTTILAPTSGTARVAGFDVRRDGYQVRLRVGVALQDIGLDPLMTSEELLVLQGQLFGAPRGEARTRARELLRTVGLDSVPPSKRVGQFSGGMKRRLDLALALVHAPKVLFLDEPTTGLDPVSRAAVWEEVRRLNREGGMTIFLTTQYLEEADRLAERVAIIDNGRIVAQGSPETLKREMGNEVMSLTFGSPADADRASEALRQVCRGLQVAGKELLCYVNNAAQIMTPVIRLLDEAGLSLVALSLSRPSLDDVYLKATGARLAANRPEPAAAPAGGGVVTSGAETAGPTRDREGGAA
jgi:ABC-2 type transport system ATP-binding protein